MVAQFKQAVLPASQFKAKALPLHVNVTHTPPSAADDDTIPATSADPGHLGALTLVPSSFNTGSYGWKGSKHLTIELENDTGSKEKVKVMLSFYRFIVAISAILVTSIIVSSPTFRKRDALLFDNPALEWQDNIYPFRQQQPWDISTDFHYPRLLEYQVQEGTWLRLDVHPTTGDIVFDMLGDLYCIPASETLEEKTIAQARPVLLGIPHDTEPRFSPDGTLLAFRSDAELGIDNIWILNWTSCEEMDRRPLTSTAADPLLAQALAEKQVDEDLFFIQHNRLIREGRLSAQRVTNETYRYVSSPRFHPSGKKIITSKWYTGRITIAASEGWEYTLPDLSILQKPASISSGSGRRVLGRTLPRGMTVDDYADQVVGPEQFLYAGNDLVIFAKNVVDEYMVDKKDVHKGVYALFSRNLTSGKEETLVDAFPGGASRPELSRDGRSLAFVRHVGEREALVIKDLQSGSLRYTWYGLTYEVPLTTNGFGEKTASGTPRPIRFNARIEKRLADTRTPELDVLRLETEDTQRVHALKELALDDIGSTAVFQAAGVSVVQVFGETTGYENSPYYSPSFVLGANNFVIHARWSDTHFTTLELANIDSGIAYFNPIVGEGPGAARKISFVRSAGDLLTGSILATARPGLYVGEINLPSAGISSQAIPVQNLRFIPSDVDASDLSLTVRFIRDSALLVQQSSRVFTVPIETGPEQTTILSGRMSKKIKVENVAFLEHHHTKLWAKPGNSTNGLVRLSVDGGHALTWSRDGTRLSWLLGPIIHSLDVSKISRCVKAAQDDQDTFGILCTMNLIDKQEVFVEHSTDIARLNMLLCAVVIHNATILTMDTGNEAVDLIERGMMLIEGGVIAAIGREEQILIPAGAVTIDALGGFVIPGFIDIHAHWSGYTTRYPAKSWEMQNFLAYGVTTLHNPSSDSVNTFVERSRLESGQFIGPRILTSGTVVFAGTWTGLYEEIVNDDQARAALNRIKAEGGPWALSYKNYQLPSRASRQRLLKTSKDLQMLCFPEGGANFDWDLTYMDNIVIGMTTLEHSFPFPVAYEDVSKLFAQSGTAYTPTYVVSYAGPWGEEYVWANHDVPNDPKLRNHMRHGILEKITESIARPLSSYVLFNASSYAAKMVHEGLRIHIGAHGEQPMGHNFHAEMFFTKSGGLTNYEVLQAATVNAASTLGILPSVGTLAVGKLADFLIYMPGIDLLGGPVEETTKLRYVSRGGRIWDAFTMTEVWPVTGRKQEMPSFNPT
ncbi:hypothetical protein BT96DRAFT_957632 [Gymnopus androsaceus JB14]|uniref:Amidohydrolase-related domain-containing protein n=1 Tax=Gymnopus androsaceus JB14 TaxID=1447944 RepID=A0A6A4HK09_9AGAR|nr:hypothetical protein BT96DRAFT_957632 [Gymnopus androsaceus JB14]